MSEERPPDSFTRELSEQEERDVLLGFMGSVYGESKALDGNIIGATNTLNKQNSEKVKQQVEELVKTPTTQSVPAPMAPPPAVTEPVELPQPVQVISQPVTVPPTPEDSNQLTFDFDISEKEELFSLIKGLVNQVNSLKLDIRKLSETLDKKNVSKKKSVESNKK